MSDAVDLVMVDTFAGRGILARAPGYSGLKPKDTVIVAGTQAIVVDIVTVYMNEDVYPFILKLWKGQPIPQIESLVSFKPFKYPDEPEGGVEDG